MLTITSENHMKTVFSYDAESVKKIFEDIIQRHISPDAWGWLQDKKQTAPGSSAFNTGFAAMPRKTGKTVIKTTEEENNKLQQLRAGFTINNWPVDRLGRVWLLMQVDPSNEEQYFQSIDQLFLSAEMNELVALYSALPLLAYEERWRKRCADGIRSNIGDVLQAIICNNPYPAEQLDEKAWNQLVLKAFFTEKPVDEIYHLDQRANQELANTISDFAHERWAAGRAIHPLAWRCVGPFINESIFPDITKIATSENAIERGAAALACYNSSYQPAKKLLEAMPGLKEEIEKGKLTWSILARKIK
jgi:hypothetical protein